MESSWGFVIFLWSVIIIGLGVLFVCELRKSPEQKKHEAEMARKRWEKNRLAEKIVEVRLLDGITVRRKRGGMRGALLGLFLGGVAGAAVSAALPGMDTEEVSNFLVKYGDGRERVFQCARGSCEYKAWMKYVKK